MKKFLIIIVLFFAGLVSVDAKTYYSDYSEYSPYQDEIVEANDTTLVEQKRVYQAYTEKMDYEFLEENNLYEKTGQYTKEIVGGWYSKKSSLIPNLEYEYCETNTYRTYIGYDYFYIRNLSSTKVSLKNISIYNQKSMENIYSLDKNTLEPNDIFFLNIKDKLSVLNLGVIFDTENDSSGTTKLEIGVAQEVSYNTPKALMYTYSTKLSKDHADIKKMNYEKAFTYTVYTLICDTTDKDLLFNTNSAYRNYIIKYEYKVPKREYIDLFLEEANDQYKIDHEIIKMVYRFKKRHKVEINDNLVISDKKTKLTDFIISSTTDDIKITSNLDLNVNGTYKINFILPFKTITKDIVVDIKENYVTAIKLQDSIVKDLSKKVEETNYQVDKKNQEIKSVLEDSSEQITSLEKEIDNKNIIIDNLKDEKEEIKETKVKKQSLNFIYLIILITIIFIINKVAEKKFKKR